MAGAAAFVALVVLVTTGASASVDSAVSRDAVAAALRHPGLTRAAQTVEAVAQPVWAYSLAALAVLVTCLRGRVRPGLVALVTCALTWVASPVVKHLVGRARPVVEAGLSSAGGPAFPSGHATASMSVVLVLVLLAPRRLRPVVAGAGAVAVLVVGVDRVWLGAHWPTDVLAGWALAVALVAGVAAVDRGVRG